MGYIGNRSAKNIVYTGLQQLEYRGYDSSGIAVLDDTVSICKAVGDTSNLSLAGLPDAAVMGIGHTRWATHGKPSVDNAHPHVFGDIVLVHNGIIENYDELKKKVAAERLVSETDSEVLAALIDHYFGSGESLLEATKKALLEVRGTFGTALFSVREPGKIIVARRGSPIVIGIDEQQHYVASDPSAIVHHTDKVVYLKDDQIGVVRGDALELYDLKLATQDAEVELLDGAAAEELHKGGFSSFLEKEIHEQPQSLRNVMRGRVGEDGHIKLGGPNIDLETARQLKTLLIIGCGTAYYAGYHAKYELERMLGLPVIVEHASEFRYRHGAFDASSTLAIFMSQSGETADTIASLREAGRRGMKTMGIVNTVGSTMAREVSHGGIYLHAGVESSVASTKAYTSMVAALLMFGAQLSYMLGHDAAATRQTAHQLRALPAELEYTLALWPVVEKLGKKLAKFHNWFFLGRGSLYPVALEGALKMTEVCYIHAQAFPSGEMKHGPIALVDERHLSVLLLPEDELLYRKSLSTMEEIKSRGGNILTISTRPKEPQSDYHIEASHLGEYADGLIYVVCLQMLTLAVAMKKGVNIDRPRNLAKSVTVE